MQTLYDNDFYAWGKDQLSLLESKQFTNLDLPHLIQEFESVVRREKNELKSKLEVLFIHLLKWKYQDDIRSKSWKNTINFCRSDLEILLESSPSLKNEIDEFLLVIFNRARKKAKEEMGFLKDLPKEMPFTIEQALDSDWIPE